MDWGWLSSEYANGGLAGACLCYAKDPGKGVGGGMEQ